MTSNEVKADLDAVNTELNLCIKSGVNTLTSNVTWNSGKMFCGVTSSKIAHLSGVPSNVRMQLGDVTLTNYKFKFCSASAVEIR